MFVQALDDRLYKDPIIEGDGFFIRFCDQEDPEIVIKYSPTSTLKSSRDLCYKRFAELEMRVRINNPNEGDEDQFSFPPLWRGLSKGARWTFKPLAPIPVPMHYTAVIDYPSPDRRFIAWKLSFDMKDVLDFLDKNIFHNILVSFIVGREKFPPLDPKEARAIKKKIEQQIKGCGPCEKVTLYRKDGE